MGESRKAGQAIGYCDDCAKLFYTTRKEARFINRQFRPRKSVYNCPINPQFFHVGGLPDMVRQGHLTRSEYYDHGASA